MGTTKLLSVLSLCTLFTISYGCSMQGVSSWNLMQTAEIQDIHRGRFFERTTTDILRVISAVPSSTLNNGPYMNVYLADSTFVIETNENFAQYEEYETALNMTITVTFECAGSNPSLVFFIMVQDTNNNDPIFQPNDVFEFTVMPPLPPGYQVANILPLTVRDIDLTTERIDFEVFDSTYFEIAYDETSSTTAKEFRASLRTTTFIRNIPEPIEFTIRATDVDLTNDPRRSRTATIRVLSDGSFELPEELVFTQTFYMADYDTENNEIALQEPISLRQGYHEEVKFLLDTGEHTKYFDIVQNGNNVAFRVIEPIPPEILALRKLFLVVRADREYTSGASATVILQLPEVVSLQFENPIYVGTIEDNVLQLPDLVLSQGYENQIVSVEIQSDYASNFEYNIEENNVTISMTPLNANVIQQNTFLNLKVVASTPVSSASTVVTLEIIKNDSLTPVFQRALYTGIYNVDEGLTLEQIALIQGYDDTVEILLSGDHSELFGLNRDGPNTNLVVTTLPSELFRDQQILLTIEAIKPRTVGASAAISISLPPETLLEFEQLNYKGEIIDNALELGDLVLRQGYQNEVITVEIQHEHASFFNYIVDENRISVSMLPLDASIIEENSFLNLLVIASTSRSSATTTVTLDIIKNDTTTPAFERAVYSGSYDSVDGLSLELITIVQGYDNTVEVTLEGDHKDYFQLVRTEPNIQLTTINIPAELYPLGPLLLTIVASKPRTVGANAAISISLPPARILRFSQETYRGTIQDNTLSFGTIFLSTGYSDDIELTLSGDYASYFQTPREQNQISIQFREQLPETVITENDFLLLTLLSSAPHAISTTTTILLEIIKEDVSTPVFNEKIYTVTYTSPTSLEVPTIFLTQGYDGTVSFRITGEHSEHFTVNPTGNNVELSIRSAIPEELIFNEKVLVFNIIADKPLTVGARAAVSVNFPTELTEPTVLAFSKNIFTGSLEGNELDVENIELNAGFTTDVEFTLNNYEAYFQVDNNNSNTVTISLINTLPPEILTSKFIALELNARKERAVPVTSTIIIYIIQPEPVLPPVFSEAFYRAVYTDENLLQFEGEISLSQGFDDTVYFELEGDYTSLFNVTNDGNVVVITTNGIPENILDINHNLIFAIVASKTGAIDGRATIVVDLPKAETQEVVVLGFTQPSYVGKIQDETLQLPPVALAGVYDMAIALSPSGEYASYFNFTRESNIINIELSDNFPSEIASNLIIIDLEASYPNAISGFTTLAIELVKEPETQIVTPVFEQAYYVGQYSEQGALVFEHTIQLIQGFDETVSIYLEGEDEKYFNLVQIGQNSFSLTTNDLIQQINDRSHLLFSVVAIKPGTLNGEAAIVITLTDVSEGQVLGFERINYVGSLDDSTVTLPQIVLNEGFTPDVQFNLLGDLATYFALQQDLATVTLTLRDPIPDNLLPTNRIVVLQLQASAPQVLPAYTTLILEVVVDEVDAPATIDLVFTETYYVGSYSATDGLSFGVLISLAEGYDESVEFDLEGEYAQWFRLDQTQNGATLAQQSPVPPSVLANNQQLIFAVRAKRPGSTTARATIVIQLTDDVSGGQVLGFERINYVGSLDDNTVTLPQIVLNEGFTPDVQFNLLGDLATYFALQQDLATVTLTLRDPIPDNLLPSNRIVVLQLQASAPQVLPAYTTLILEVVVDEVDPPATIDLIFTETYYVGSYSATDGLSFGVLISLAEGYDESVEFDLEGENAQWFRLDQTQNGATLAQQSPVPPSVLANNQQLIFAVRAKCPGSTTARATIVIQLTDDVSGGQVLGFERINYVGSLDDSTVTLPQIVLNEGFTPDVQFNLLGDLATYFALQQDLATVTLTLRDPIPDNLLPSNRIVVLQLQASAPQVLPAYTTLILEVVVDEVDPPATIDLVFTETYYVGSYSATDGLSFGVLISLAEGYDESVEFDLEGENAQWFRLDQTQNGATLAQQSPVPPSVLANNQQLIFAVRAKRPGSTTARATIVIQLTDDVSGGQVLGFERINYVGSLDDSTVTLPQIVLNEGFTPDVQFNLLGDLATYFALQQDLATVTLTLRDPIPDNLLPSNRIVVLQLQASAPQVLPAYTTLILEVVVDEVDPPATIDLVFTETYYVGSYSATDGLSFGVLISLAEGYDESVEFDLEGEYAQWFRLDQTQNGATLAQQSPVPPSVLANNQQLIFAVRAKRPGSTTARATIVIQLTDDVSGGQVLGFERINYVGSLDDSTVTLPQIVLNEGFTPDLQFNLLGDLATYFALQQDLATVTLTLRDPIPDNLLPSNRIVVLQLQASAPQVLPAYTTLILEVVVDEVDPPATIDLVFTETYYVGSYSATDGLSFGVLISLAEGYDESVEFDLEGENAQWFRLDQTQNGATLAQQSPVPPSVLANNQQLIFAVRAKRPGSTTARATIVIQLTDDVSGGQVLGFERINYMGSLDDSTVTLPQIVLNEGFTPDVQFNLLGDLATYFALQQDLATVTLTLRDPIPDNLLPSNRIVVLQLQASAPQVLPAYTTLILEVVIEEVDPPATIDLVFTETYYVGSYSATDGLSFGVLISLAEGYDESVEFDLEGENAQWFRLDQTQNGATLAQQSPVPPSVLANNQQLIFAVRAKRPGSTTARATIVIQLTDDVSGGQVLGFERINYMGSLDDSTVTLPQIVLNEGFTPDVQFNLLGDLATYFALQQDLATVTLTLRDPIPDNLLPSNRIVVLQLQASAPQVLPAYTTLILEVVIEEVDPPATIDLVFTETYYVGSYSATDGLSFGVLISLAEGYDESVEFDLEGENAQWFRLDQTQNGATLAQESPVPPSVLANNQQLIFAVRAKRPGSTTARATIVVQLTDDVSGGQVLGFERINYMGSLDDSTVTLPQIVLNEGFTPDVQFNLLGDLATYFALQQDLATVTLTLRDPIPDNLLPSNRIVVLQLQASAPQVLPAYTTLILEVVVDEVDPPATIDLVFTETYYVGSYSATDGLSFGVLISLAEGYDESVEFDLEGENAQWFRLDQTQNSATLVQQSPVPPSVLANNQQLIFAVRAKRPGSTTARATIVIQLTDDVSGGQVLGFERINYMGSLDDSTVTLPQIVLNEGFTPDVQFNLLGDLATYFALQQDLATVTLTLRDPIPDNLLPSNRIVVLQLQASAPQVLPAYTTLILEVVIEEVDPPATIDLVFTETYYVGSYSATDGLSFGVLISLAEGYDESVEFDLEGENAQWFRLDQTQNSATLVQQSPVPPSVLANNQQLIFAVRAKRPGSTTARATIVIQLTDDVSGGQVLGFERINYMGSLDDSTVTLPQIVLNEGFTLDVQFNLLGDLATYFALQQDLATVTLTLRDPIPDNLLPSNRIVVLQLQASAPQVLPAYTTLILEVVVDEVDPPATIDLVFTETYYVGSYSATDGLSFGVLISLAEGYDESVEFDLEGENAQWFRLDQTQNGATLAQQSPVPPSVLANNQQLIFAVHAKRPGSTTARATIVIQLTDDGVVNSVAFGNILYEGRIQGGVVQHETITIDGFEKDQVDIIGTYGSFFTARHFNGLVVVEAAGSLTLPADANNVVLELRADDDAAAVLLLAITGTEPPVMPIVAFSSASYVIRVEMGQTGAVGQVEATADNGEAVTYTLLLDNEHLQTRLSVNSEGELRLSAPADSGVYNFQVIATTVFTGSTGSATIYFSVQAIVVCGDDIVTAPLIVIERDEEEPHRNLVVIDPSEHEGCRYNLANKWPADHNWLYVDDTGLHAHIIDREDPSIAFMAISQIQVELTLHCNTKTRIKRSTESRHEWLGPYDYGTNTWLLGNTIEYNPRRTIVNLIINDINDNTPKFIEEEIIVGYPVADLASTVVPRALIQVKATDADVGKNAALVYWSSEPQLAVSSSTGFVHVRNDAELTDNMQLAVNATDLNGQGLTGTILLTVKLLNTNNIAVLTVKNAFLEDESLILSNLSNALGYEIKSLRSDILPDADTNQEQSSTGTEISSRKKREVKSSTGASLALHVYGLIEREPVVVEKLSNDINENAAVAAYTITSIITLEEHLAGICNISEGNTGFFVATIVLSVLLILFIVAAVIFFIYIRRKGLNYEPFSDTNSLASQIESPVTEQKPDGVSSLPRLNIEELKRSERRLQDMLNAPIKEVVVEPSTSTNNPAIVSSADTKIPIIIHDKLKDNDDSDEDEFGERKKGRRKSVVTFNENVEKIIHVEENPEDLNPPEAEYEVYKL